MHDYARAHPCEAISAKAGDFANSVPGEPGEQPPVHAQPAGEERGASSSSQGADANMPQGAGSATSPAHQPSKRETEYDDTGGDSKPLHSDKGEVAISHGDVVPQAPQSVAGDTLLDDAPLENMMSPNMMMDVDTVLQQGLNLEEDPDESISDLSACIKELSYPCTPQEPQLSKQELQRLDSNADQVEIERLFRLEVLLTDTLPPEAQSLSTWFVRSWREKRDESGMKNVKNVMVAREFSWLQPDREAVFSPASSNIATRVLPVCYLAWREHMETLMLALDVKDAFLIVEQEQPTDSLHQHSRDQHHI